MSVIQRLVSEVHSYSEKKTVVENAASQLKEFSRREDCDVVQNLIVTVQDRYHKLHQHTIERGKALETVKKQAKQVLIGQTFFIHSMCHCVLCCATIVVLLLHMHFDFFFNLSLVFFNEFESFLLYNWESVLATYF